MHLVQLLLPLYDDAGERLPAGLYASVANVLTAQFGGLTAYTRAPAKGLWRARADSIERDDVVIYEVMAEALDRVWWRRYRERLEHDFRQEQVVIRAQELTLL